MARFSVHGLVVETSSDLGSDPAAELLAGHPAAEPGAGADLRIDVRRASSQGEVDGLLRGVPVEGAETILLQGTVRVQAGQAIWVGAPGFVARVLLAGDRVEARVLDGAVDRHALPHVHLFLAFAAALRLRGRYHLHAACTVAPGTGGLLIAGQGGSGKSTLCAALVASGHAYLGDDVVFVDGATGRLQAFPRTFHLGPSAVLAIPGASSHLGGRYSTTEKQAFDPRAAFPGREVSEAGPPRALLFPRVGEAAITTLEAIAPVEATARLIESSAFVASRLPGHRAHLAALAALADGATAWRVVLGRDLLEDAEGTARAIATRAGLGSP
jgi:hypothetical protein